MNYYRIFGTKKSGEQVEIYLLSEEQTHLSQGSLSETLVQSLVGLTVFKDIIEIVKISKQEYLDRISDTIPSLFIPASPNGSDKQTESGALYKEGDTDYTLKEEFSSVWIGIDTTSLWIRRTDDGIEVVAAPRGREAENTITVGDITHEEVQKLQELRK